jgi:hypothetical protein
MSRKILYCEEVITGGPSGTNCFFLIRLSDKRLYAEPALDNAVSGMVTARLVIPQHTAPLLFLHRVPPTIHTPKILQKQHIPKFQELFMSV